MDKRKLESLPQKPGIYKFFNKEGELLYVGKAINLRNRVKSYFSSELFDRPRVRKMIPLISDIQIQETNNEIESLILESLLIKKHQPKYNSDLKDDKSYAWLYISTQDRFPTVEIVREIKAEKYKKGKLFGPYPSGYTVKRIFTYLRKIYPFCTCKEKQSKECLYFHLGLCPGPYWGHISEEEYRKNIEEIIKFLRGRKRGHISNLEKQMNRYSKLKNYEQAALLRDRINDLKYLSERIGFEMDDTEETYRERRAKVIEENFENLRLELNLSKLSRIECYDISNTQGKEAYGSMVVANDGAIDHSEYRIFKIKTLDTPNDPFMLREVLSRRFDEKNLKKYKNNPEIVLIDGGKSQLSQLKDVIPNGILLLGISKGKRLKRKGVRQIDEFWSSLQGKIQRVDIVNSSILIDLRDEAHRFAILHHRKQRAKYLRSSILDNISGVGVKRSRALLKHFKGTEGLKKASLEEVNGIVRNKKLAQKIMEEINT